MCVNVYVCGGGWGVGMGAAGRFGRQEADMQRSFPTAVAIYLCLGPPGRSDTNGITLTVGQKGGERERQEFVCGIEGGKQSACKREYKEEKVYTI